MNTELIVNSPAESPRRQFSGLFRGKMRVFPAIVRHRDGERGAAKRRLSAAVVLRTQHNSSIPFACSSSLSRRQADPKTPPFCHDSNFWKEVKDWTSSCQS